MDIIKDFRQQIIAACQQEIANLPDKLSAKITLEAPKDSQHGDLSTNAALLLSGISKQAPINLAENLSKLFKEKFSFCSEISIAKPGFINFKMQPAFWQNSVKEIYLNPDFAKNNLGNNEKINIEFGSPNPTGPLHVGHTRGAIFGDVLANILNYTGYLVTKENYVNDAGKQIDVLAKSLYLRYQEIANNETLEIPEGLYPGEYLIPVAADIHAKFGNEFLQQDEQQYLDKFKSLAVTAMLELIKQGFSKLGIKHDVHFSEKTLHDNQAIKTLIEKLSSEGKTYQGCLPKPKGTSSEDWEEREQLLFRTTDFGDDIDRALQKSDGNWTYFAADAAYHQNKLERGFKKMILILGADHTGYQKRMQAMVSALSDGEAEIQIKLCQIVKFLNNGEAVKMSKRAGTFLTAEDVVNEVGMEALRFTMLTRKNDAPLDFDYAKVVEQSKDNPIFYVQYAHARICSVLRQENYASTAQDLEQVKLLTLPQELELLKQLNLLPNLLENISQNYEAHRLSFYLYDLAAKFHSYWSLGNTNNAMRIISSDKNITEARLILLKAVRNTLSTGLKLFNVAPLERM